MAWAEELGEGFAHGDAISIGYVLILLPAHRPGRTRAERNRHSRSGMILLTAAPMRFFYYDFHLPRIVLRGTARLVLRLLGVKSPDLGQCDPYIFRLRSLVDNGESGKP